MSYQFIWSEGKAFEPVIEFECSQNRNQFSENVEKLILQIDTRQNFCTEEMYPS